MQPGGWAAALRKGLDDGGKNVEEPDHSGFEARAQGETALPAATPIPPLTGKAARAAARQRLLDETLKSRANAVTGERHCLACGRGFMDLSRFVQHLADKHGGVNSTAAPIQAPPPTATAFPALSPAPTPLRLSDVAVVRQGAGAPAPQEVSRKAGPAVPGAAGIPSRRPTAAAAAAAFQAPKGTRARHKKRPSKLKRGFMHSRAAAAVEHWLSVLSAVEEALQVAGEAHGAALNEAVAARAALEAASSREAAAGLFVRLQVLKAQERGAVERLEGLCGVHHSARAHLVRAQAMLREVEGGGGGRGEEGEKGEPVAAAATAPAAAPQPAPEHEVPAAVPVVVEEAVDQEAAAEDETTESEAALGSGSDSDDASGLGGFQNVLGQWAHASGAVVKPSAPKPKAAVPPLAPPPASPAPPTPVAAQARDAATQQKETVEEPTVSQRAPEEAEKGSQSNSDSDSDDGSSFGLQWGDTLRAWAVNAGTDARAALEQQRHEEMAAADADDAATASRAEASAGPSLPPLSPPTLQHQTTTPIEQTLPQQQPSGAPAAAAPAAAAALPEAPASAAPVKMPGSEVVRAWLSRKDAPSQGACIPPPPAESVTSSATPHGLAATAAPFLPQLGLPELDLGFSALTRAPHAAAAPAPGLHCPICGVTASGPKAWMDHLNSRRHASRVRHAAEGASAAELAALPQPFPSSRVAAAATPTGLPAPARTYVGANADVAPYVDHVITPEINAAVEALLRRLLEWQERARRLDPVNARRKRRVVSGMREVEKAAKLGKAKLLVVAPNVGALAAVGTAAAVAAGEGEAEAREGALNGEEGSVGDITYPVAAALEWARQKEVPVVFALTRQRLGRLLGSRKTASAFAVLEASGAEEALREVVAAVAAAREERQR